MPDSRQPPTILIAPNAFKGSLDAATAAAAMARGLRQVRPAVRCLLCPLADGGDGLLERLISARGGLRRNHRVTGPLGAPVNARLGWLPDTRTAVIEMALASGLALVPPERRACVDATTQGTGELIRHALDLGARRILVGLGGSASCDGGTGAAAALGARFLDRRGHPLPPTGRHLGAIRRLDLTGLDPRLRATTILGLCDVRNPLYGPRGAAAVFAPQKGASPAEVRRLDAGLAHLADLIRATTGRAVARLPGAGAAGGLGAGLVAFCGARLQPGAATVAAETGFTRALARADLVITGEGRLDDQTPQGKVPGYVAAQARAAGIPCIGLGGSVADHASLRRAGFAAVFSLCDGPLALPDALRRAESLLAVAAAEIARVWLIRRR